ncbi:MAG: TonB-dependent receptor plug domain-containing protein [Pseudomonadota bacterium]
MKEFMKRVVKMMIMITSFFADKRRAETGGVFRVRNVWISACCTCFFFMSVVLAIAEAGGEKKENITTLEEILVIGIPYSNPVTPVNTRYGTQYNLVTEEQIAEQNAYDFQSALRDVPGVMFQSKNLMGSQTSHSLYIRGRGASHPSADFAVQFDGVPRFGALFGQVLGDGIALSTIGGIEVFKSPQPSQFGNGYASVNILPKYLTEEGQEMTLNFSGGSYATFDQSLSGGLKRGPFDFYVSQSWASTDGHEDHSRGQQQNYYANTGYELNDEWSIRLLANYVSGQTLAAMPDTVPTATNGVSWPAAERFDTETSLASFTLNHQYAQAGGYLKAYWNDTSFDLLQELTNGKRAAGGTGGLWSRQEISLYGIRAREKLQLWPGGEILAGADLDMTELKNTQRTYSGLAVQGINGGRAERVWEYPDTTLFSPYAGISQMVGHSKGFHIIPSAGLRYFLHNEFKDQTVTHAGLVTGYGHTDLNFNYSRGVNYPSPVVVMNMVLESAPVSDPDQYWEDIKPEVVDHYEVGLTHTWPEKASLGATAFCDKGKDRFQAYMFGPVPTRFNDPIGEYEIRGLELTGKVTPLKKVEFFAGATWLEAEARGSDAIERDYLPYTPGFQFQAGMSCAFMENFRIFMDMQHLRDVYQGTARRTGTFTFSQLGDGDKLDDITLFNGRLSYRFDYVPLRLHDSEIFLAANNIFDQDYEYAKGYGMPGATVFAGFSMKFK